MPGRACFARPRTGIRSFALSGSAPSTGSRRSRLLRSSSSAGTSQRASLEHSVFATVLLPIALAVIMVSLGTSLVLDDFRRVVVYPRGIAIGLANLLVLSPLLAFAVAEAYNLEPALAV